MAGGEENNQQPRNPRDMQALLKFCLDATRGEDAPATDVEAMDEERRQWLQEALAGMSVDVVQQLTNGIKVLLDSGNELEDKEETLDRLEDWLGNIDMAINFHKIGGFPALWQCLTSEHPTLRSGSAHLVAEISQNNPYCQDKFLADGFLGVLTSQLDKDSDETCRVKALYAISCMCREYPPAVAAFAALDGWSVLLRAIQTTHVPRLRTKACFFLSHVVLNDPSLVADLVSMGLVLQLAAVLQEPHDLTHEHVLSALLTLARGSSDARHEVADSRLKMEQLLSDKYRELEGQEEYSEARDHCRALLALCFKDDDHSADR